MKVGQGWKGMMMMTIVALSVLTISCDDDKATADKNYNITGNANGSQVVPAVSGTGSGNMTGTYNRNTRVLNYTNSWAGLSGAPTGGGLFSGASGMNGAAVGTSWTYTGSTTATGSTSGIMTLTESQEEQLLAGNWYYSYNTATNPNGEIRGQISNSRE